MSLTSGLDDLSVITITRQGMEVARRLEAALPARVTVYVSDRYDAEAPPGWVRFPRKVLPLVDAIWARHEAHVFVMAAGIVVRAIAPHVQDKRWDPGVVVMDILGRHAIALCSGHLGGANELCRLIAERCGAEAVITTGTDVNRTLAPDVLAKAVGGDLEDWAPLKEVSAALVDGLPVAVWVEPGVEVPDLAPYADRGVVRVDDPSQLGRGRAAVAVTSRLLPDPGVPMVTIRPPVLALGIGCNRGTPVEEIEEAVDAVLAEAGYSPRSVARLATFEKKRDEPGLLAFARRRDLALTWYDAAAIEAAPPYPNPSEVVRRYVGVAGVAEPAALLAAGTRELLLPKVRRGNLTLALARIAGDPVPPTGRLAPQEIPA